MSDNSPWSIAITIWASIGGGAVVGFLMKWLADLTAKRILQREQNAALESLEGLKQELSLARLGYDKHVQHVVDYYSSMFYRTYQLCQRTEHADLIRHPDREDLYTNKDYLEQVDSIAEEWGSKQGLLRLVLPREAFDLHEKAIAELNSFKHIVTEYDNGAPKHADLRASFLRIDAIKKQLEGCLRKHLRIDGTWQSMDGRISGSTAPFAAPSIAGAAGKCPQGRGDGSPRLRSSTWTYCLSNPAATRSAGKSDSREANQTTASGA